MELLMVGLGGAIGAMGRYLINVILGRIIGHGMA